MMGGVPAIKIQSSWNKDIEGLVCIPIRPEYSITHDTKTSHLS
jgi:hypothetical protein